MPIRHALGPTSDIPANGCRTYGLDVDRTAVYDVVGRFYGISSTCPHAGADLSQGTVHGGVVTCPGHGIRFDITTGAGIDRDDLSLTQFVIEVDNDMLYVTF